MSERSTDTTEDRRSIVLEVMREHPDQEPALVGDLGPAVGVAAELRRLRVVASVVLDSDSVPRVGQVEAGHKPRCRSEQVPIDLRFGQSAVEEEQSQLRLLRRLDSGAGELGGVAEGESPTPARDGGNLCELCSVSQAMSEQEVGGGDELREAKTPGRHRTAGARGIQPHRCCALRQRLHRIDDRESPDERGLADRERQAPTRDPGEPWFATSEQRADVESGRRRTGNGRAPQREGGRTDEHVRGSHPREKLPAAGFDRRRVGRGGGAHTVVRGAKV